MIPPQEINESIKSFLKCCYTLNFCPNEKELTFLTNTYKLYDIFLDNYLKKEFVCVSPGDKCQKLIFFIGFIKIGGITKHFVEILSDSLQSSFPYTLRDQIRTYLSEKKNKSIYIDLCNDLQIVPYFNFDSTDKNTSIQNL